MKKTVIPTKDEDLLKLALRGKRALSEDDGSFGFTDEEIEEFLNAVDDYDARYARHKKKQVEARAERAGKEAARKRLRKILRKRIRWMRANPDLPEGKLFQFGVAPADKIRTPVKAPDTAPEYSVSYAPAEHIIRFWEEGSTRHRRKPYGVVGVEIYANIGGGRDDPKPFPLKEIALRSPHRIKYKQEDVGKQVHYYLVWLTRRGERSVISRIESATIAN